MSDVWFVIQYALISILSKILLAWSFYELGKAREIKLNKDIFNATMDLVDAYNAEIENRKLEIKRLKEKKKRERVVNNED